MLPKQGINLAYETVKAQLQARGTPPAVTWFLLV